MQQPQQLNITVGTDVVLHDRLVFDGETFDPNLSTNIAANLISGIGKRTALTVEIVDEELVITVPWVEGRLPGCYGLEVTGTCNNMRWASVAQSLIHYTQATEQGASEVTVESDSYDITQVVTYRYSESPISFVSATIDGGVGTPSVDFNYDHRELSLDFHNLKGNGIASIEQTTESSEDGGTNVLTITDDLGHNTPFNVKNGHTGGIGPVGPQGATSVYDQSTQNFLTTIETTTGQSQTKTMTQKAISDEIEKAKAYDYDEINLSALTLSLWYINGDVLWKKASQTSNASSISFAVSPGDVFKIISQEGKALQIEFLTRLPTNQDLDTDAHNILAGNGTYNGWWSEGTYYVIAPSDAAYLYIRVRTSSSNEYMPSYCGKVRSINSEISWIETNADENDVSYLKAVGTTDGKALKNDKTIETNADWCYTDYIPVVVGDVIDCTYGKYQSGVACMHYYDKYKNVVSYSSSYNGDFPDAQWRHLTLALQSVRYCRFCHRIDAVGFMMINGKVAYSSLGYQRGYDETIDGMSKGTMLTRTFLGVGKGTTLSAFNLGKLKAGARYIVETDQNTQWLNRDLLTYEKVIFQISCIKGSNTTYPFPLFKTFPIPQRFEFIAQDNDYYRISFRAVQDSLVKVYVSLCAEDMMRGDDTLATEEERTLVRNAKLPQTDSSSVLGLLHYTDIHGDDYAAGAILAKAKEYSGYINDVVTTGDVVHYYTDADANYPQGTTWWRNCGLAEKSLFVLGNHDCATINATEYDVKEDSAAWDGKGQAWGFDNYFADYISGLGVTMPSGYNDSTSPYYKACYWHKDYASQKVRVIGIDCVHRFDGELNAPTFDATTPMTSHIGTVKTAGYKQTETSQEEWLVARLAECMSNSGNAAAGYSVVFLCHYPLDDMDGLNKQWSDDAHEWICNQNTDGGTLVNQATRERVNLAYQDRTTFTFEKKFSLHNRANMRYTRVTSTSGKNPKNLGWYISDGYGGYIRATDTSPVTGMTYYQCVYDKGATNNIGDIIEAWMNAGGKYVAWLCGHTHWDGMMYPTAYPNCLTIILSQAGWLRPYYNIDKSDLRSGRLSANYLAIDTNLKLIKVVRFGNKTDRYLVSQKYLVYDYYNRKVISEG